MKQNKRTPLIVEKSRDGKLYGRVSINHNLLVASAPTMDLLKKAVAKLVFESEGLKVDEFEIAYDLTGFFDQYNVSITEIAMRAGINAALMRQYASGLKFPSAERVRLIEKAVHDYAKELVKVRLVKTGSKPGNSHFVSI